MDEVTTWKYNVTSPVLRRFHDSRALVRLVLGPYGSGKTYACCWEIVNLAFRMPPDKFGVRRSRCCFIRDTATNLKDTTVNTWLKLFPEKINGVRFGTEVKHDPPMEMWLRLPHWDGKTTVELHILCRYQDNPADAENLKSLDLSSIYINEASGVPLESVVAAVGRIKRFPAKEDLILERDANGNEIPPRFGIIMDSNMPNTKHWIYRQFEVIKPEGWELFRQPPAMFKKTDANGKIIYVPNRGQMIAQGIPPADNISNLNDGFGYYEDLTKTGKHDWINVHVCANYGTLQTGLPVYPEYRDTVHYVDAPIAFDRAKPLFLGFDYGLRPSVAFVQINDYGQICVLDEIDGGARDPQGIEFLWTNTLRPKLVNEYGFGCGTKIIAVGDPAGKGRDQTYMSTPLNFLIQQGISIVPCHTNDPVVRWAAVKHFLNGLASGRPAIMFAKPCVGLRAGMQGDYHFKEKQSGDISGVVADNDATHIQDALQYVCHVIRFASEYNVSAYQTVGGSWNATSGAITGNQPDEPTGEFSM